MNIKQKFPSEQSFRDFLNEEVSQYTKEIFSELGHLDSEFKKAKKDSRIGFLVIGVGMAGLLSSLQLIDVLFEQFIVLALMALFSVVLIYVGVKHRRGTSEIISTFNKKLNELVFEKVFSVFGLSSSVVDPIDTNAGKRKDVYKLIEMSAGISQSQRDYPLVFEALNKSELITESRNRFVVDDVIKVDFGKGIMTMTELDIKNVTGSGKNRHVKNIFHGYFFAVDLKNSLSGKTFVSTEGDTSGFGHQSLFGNKDVKKTELEWNEFEDKLHVSTSDPIEARYILTTNFMSDLYDWWKEKEQKIRVSFIENQMYFIYPDSKIRLNNTISSITEKEISEYMESISIPLLHSLYLVEDATK